VEGETYLSIYSQSLSCLCACLSWKEERIAPLPGEEGRKKFILREARRWLISVAAAA